MSDAEFWSADGVFGLLLTDALQEQLFARCEDAGAKETGCILIGYYKRGNSLAVVTDLPETPEDSIAGPAHFDRGTKGLRRLLKRLWRKRRYYLGEWHYHPSASPAASGQDHRQMREFAADERFRCPEPILLIVGGSKPNWALAANVYPSGSRVPLQKK